MPKARDAVHMLDAQGWLLLRVDGSRRQFKHPERAGLVTLAGRLMPADVHWEDRGPPDPAETDGVMKYIVVYERAGRNFAAYVPDLPGCIALGESRDEVERNIREAISFHLEGLALEGLPLPAPETWTDVVEVDASSFSP